MLVQQLPPDGALARAMRGHAWSDTEYLLANVVDAVQFGTFSTLGALGSKPHKPKPQPRPDDEPQSIGDRGDVSTADVVTYLDSLRPEKVG